MTPEQTAAIVARHLLAESRYLDSVSSFPAIRAERRRILEEAERELAGAAAEVLRADVCTTSPAASESPSDGAG